MKLKKLIVSGFKSFADRTEFEFDDGITCVVGPNGCGKSNIVDAFKWVLGSQSAKSLRGSEMADVIFNGSSGRRPSGMAEVALVFESVPSEVQPDLKGSGGSNGSGGGKVPEGVLSVARRLYRNGVSEYLINKTPCRLKDIREMFMDTGVGVDAYSLIEQGRVEVFLQASQDERRAIFDEAAGISKYKARKREALRKLDRVEQNLLRLNDIVQEVQKRLRSIKVQAGKARNYQTYSERLRELRSLHLLAQYHTLTGQRRELEGKLSAAGDRLSGLSTRIDQLEAARSSTEVESVDIERAGRELQARIGSLSGQVTTCQERAEMLEARVRELDEQVLAALARSEELEAKIESAREQQQKRRAELAELEKSDGDLAEQYKAAREKHAAGELALAQLHASLEDEKAGTIDLFRRTAQLHNEIHGLGIRKENLHGQKKRLSDRAEEIGRQLTDVLTARAEAEAKLGDVQSVIEASTTRLEETRQAAQRAHDSEQQLRGELADAREQRSALHSRTQALQEMQQRLEGVAAGVRSVLEARREGRLQAVRGMLGEFLQTDMDHASVVEAALAGADQQLLVDSRDDLAAVADELREVLGDNAAVDVRCLDRLGPLGGDFHAAACPHVTGRVIEYVRFEPDLAPLMWRLLGRTLLVETLADAHAAADALAGGFRFVTAGGEVLEADGRVRFNAGKQGAGVITRGSELASLREQAAELDDRIAALEQRCLTARNELEHLDELQQGLRTAIYEANTERVECQSRIAQHDEQITRLRREQPVVAGDIDELGKQIEQTVQAEHDAREKAEQLEELNRQRQGEIERIEGEIAAARKDQQAVTDSMTELKVALASVDEKKRAARDAVESAQRQIEAMDSDLAGDRRQIELDRQRKADAEQGIAKAREEVDRLYAQVEQLNGEAREMEETRSGLNEKLEAIRAQLAEKRKAHNAAGEQVNALKVEQGEAEVRVENLLARADDEMGMDLTAAYEDYEHDDERDWDAVASEIAELRGKIERLGNVNLDAIGEQEELQQREEFLAGQLEDVESSRRQLNDLIRRINRESRELFLETFEAVRGHFQTLFRKLFGGGKADIILLDTEDVLESGIEIIARPPGKELRSLSLLSGGEKTMTALSLMFSIFRSRPSPFCLLDEVDAALDEENTRRFSRLVQEFVGTSQFLIISHAKRTMSMADVLYGVTMQEPGVSTRISVRFEEAARHAEEAEPEPVGVG